MKNYFTYKSRPVVRKENDLYYGSMAEPYVVMMKLMEGETENDLQQATKVKCYLMKTDQGLSPMQAIKKQAELSSLYEALELAAAWLK
ncbi:MAG: hypothetical protein MJ071_08020 [Oscillospiraceae bacterium]|nr:hypothetical protein [Oscillospiraceae bacterium]